MPRSDEFEGLDYTTKAGEAGRVLAVIDAVFSYRPWRPRGSRRIRLLKKIHKKIRKQKKRDGCHADGYQWDPRVHWRAVSVWPIILGPYPEMRKETSHVIHVCKTPSRNVALLQRL